MNIHLIKIKAVATTFVLLSFACQQQPDTVNNFFGSDKVTEQDDKGIEGTINGGGGKGIRCFDIATGKTSLQLLDLYEAKAMYGLDILPSPEGSNEALDLLADKMARHFWNPSTINMDDYKNMIREGYEKFITNDARFIPNGKRLKPTNDAFEPLIDSNCELVQIAVYYDESILLIDQKLWKELNWLNRMALYAHEVLYGFDRANGVTNSISVRKLVGQMFSVKGARPRSDGAPRDPALHSTCHINNKFGISVGYLYAWNSKMTIWGAEQNGLEFVFNYLENRSPIFRTSSFFVGLNLNSLFEDQLKKSQSPLLIDSYFAYDTKGKELHLTLNGKGQGKLVIENERTAEFSEEYELSCSAPYSGH